MNNKVKIPTKFSPNNLEAFDVLMKEDSSNIESLLSTAQKIKQENFGDQIRVYIPGTKFPAISITGNYCELNCEHCDRKYLNGMKPIKSKRELKSFLMAHYKQGGNGALISGGCLSDGSVPLINYLRTIKKVKERTDLIINTHTGLLNDNTAQKLAEAGIDIVSFDINMDQEIITNIYHLDKDINDYKKAISHLKHYGLNIVPHVCIGLHYGELKEELRSIQFIKEAEINPSLIVFIVLIPPKNSKPNIKFKTPKPMDIAKILAITRIIFPKTEISLGCMRPRKKKRYSIEVNALKAGITRLEIPSKKALLNFWKEHPEIEYQFFSACCAVPKKYDNLIKMDRNEVKRRYKNIYKSNE